VKNQGGIVFGLYLFTVMFKLSVTHVTFRDFGQRLKSIIHVFVSYLKSPHGPNVHWMARHCTDRLPVIVFHPCY